MAKPSTPQLDLSDTDGGGFEIPPRLLKVRLRAWEHRPQVALKIYMDGDFMCELVHLWALIDRVAHHETQVRLQASTSPPAPTPSKP